MADTAYGIALFPQHQQLLAASAISPEVARARGYVSVDTKTRLDGVGIAKAGRSVPGLLLPVWGVDGTVRTYQYRPDAPRLNTNGKAVKYETPVKAALVLDVPPGVRGLLGDPSADLWITEGSRKADAAVTAGICCVALLGVWGWRGSNGSGGTTALACWESVALKGRNVFIAFDSDVMTKPEVRQALDRFGAFLSSRGSHVRLVYLPDGPDGTKVGLDDYLATGATVDDLRGLAQDPHGRPATQPLLPEPTTSIAPPHELDHTYGMFRHWLGGEYDLWVLDAVLATAAAERLDGDPPWLLVVGGSGAAKTETVVPLARAGAHVESTIASEAALLSGTPEHERAKDATGGLLRKIGDRGLLVLKDFTSIISMNRDARAALLAALREIHDGRWTRNVGSEGGRTLIWTGRLVLIGATTTAYDKAHQVIAAMGDRFVIVRQDSSAGTARKAAGRQALANVGGETRMRADLGEAAAGVLAGLNPTVAQLDADDTETLLEMADLVTLTRTAVEHDYRGDVIDAHAPEMPTRCAKMLGQIVRGGLALGMARPHAVAVAVRVAADSVPPLRLCVLADVTDHPDATCAEATKRLQLPRSTVDRTLQALHILGLLATGQATSGAWTYRLSDDVDPKTVAKLISTRNVSRHPYSPKKERSDSGTKTLPQGGSDISGNGGQAPTSGGFPGEPTDPALGDTIHPLCEEQP